jgi:type II restriction enzyme
VTVEGKIAFPKHRHSSWRQYVDSRRLEITCGEAPFIVSRYDAATGEAIPIERRIGLLDRKLRIVSENTDSEAEWVKWAIRAIGSVYGYEYQGDNLLIARINVLMTFVEYLQSMWHRGPTEKELTTVANIISWNFWQMDGLTGTVPKGKLQAPEARPITMEELGWFAAIDGATSSERSQEQETTPPCRICNWRQAHTVTFNLLKTHRGRDVRNMKFDYAIGNPPYQEDVQNKGDRANPVYDKFMDAAYQVADVVELIHPARFLFKAGQTSKAWNEKMLSDEHFKILHYESDASRVFPNTLIKGGVVISYRNTNENYGAIEVFTSYPELNAIVRKVSHIIGEAPRLNSIIASQGLYRFSELFFAEHPEAISLSGSGTGNKIVSSIIEKLPDVFIMETDVDGKQYVRFLGRIKNQRLYRYIRRD